MEIGNQEMNLTDLYEKLIEIENMNKFRAVIDYDDDTPETFKLYQKLSPKDQTSYQSFPDYPLGNILNSAPIPKDIEMIFSNSFNKINFSSYGCLPEIQRYYAIINKTLFFFTTNGQDKNEHVVESEEITQVTLFSPKSKFSLPNVLYFLAVSTHFYIKVYPILINNYITDSKHINPIVDLSFDFSTFYVQKTEGYAITSMAAGPPGTLFVGGSNGHLYSFSFKLSSKKDSNLFSSSLHSIKQKLKQSYEFFKTHLSLVFSTVLSIVSGDWSSLIKVAITRIVYDSATSEVAIVSEGNTIYFYNIKNAEEDDDEENEENKANEEENQGGNNEENSSPFFGESFNESFDGRFSIPPGEKLVGLSVVPYSESKYIRFVGFNQHGTRYFFGKPLGFGSLWGRVFKFSLRAQRAPPSDLDNCEVLAGYYSLGFSLLITDSKAFIIFSLGRDTLEEYIYGIPLGKTNFLCACIPQHPYQKFSTKKSSSSFSSILKNPSIWQFCFQSPFAYVLTSSFSFEIHFLAPYETILNVLPPDFHMTNQKLFELSEDLPIETLSCILLAAIHQTGTNRTRLFLYARKFTEFIKSTYKEVSNIPKIENNGQFNFQNLLYQIEKSYNFFQNPDDINIADGFTFIVARLLEVLIYQSPFVKKTKFFRFFGNLAKVGNFINSLPFDYLGRIKAIINASNDYIEERKKNMDGYNQKEINEIKNEGDKIKSLQSFLKMYIEEIRFLQLISLQPRQLIDQAFTKLESSNFYRLRKPFYETFFSDLDDINKNLIHLKKTLIKVNNSEPILNSGNVSDKNQLDINNLLIKIDTNQVQKSISKIKNCQGQIILNSALRKFLTMFFKSAAPKSNAINLFADQINSECPLFTRSPEILLENALIELDIASKMLESSNRSEIISNTEHVFLSLCNKPLDLDRICGIYIRLEAADSAVRIAVARAKAIDPDQRALAWFLSGSKSSDEKGESLFLVLQRQCYEPIHTAIFSNTGRKAIEESKDQLLSYHVFQFLLNIGEIPLLFEFNSPYLEAFLLNFHREILYQYYIKYCRFYDAAKELLNLSTNAQDITLNQRSQWLHQAVNLAKKAISIEDNNKNSHLKALDLLKECELALESVKSQKNLDELSIVEEEAIMDFPEQIEHAAQSGDWESVLRIESLQPVVDEELRKKDVQTAWKNLLESLLTKIEETDDKDIKLAMKIEPIIRSFPKSFITQGLILVPVFEDFKREHNFPLFWAGNLLGRLSSYIINVFGSYAIYINTEELQAEKNLKYELVVIALQLIYKYNLGNFQDIEESIDELLQDQDHPLFLEADKLTHYIEQREKYNKDNDKEDN